jgi:hypothetical protein
LNGRAHEFAPQLLAFMICGAVIEHFLHAVLRGVTHVHSQQIVRFARRLAVLGRPGVVHLFEYGLPIAMAIGKELVAGHVKKSQGNYPEIRRKTRR